MHSSSVLRASAPASGGGATRGTAGGHRTSACSGGRRRAVDLELRLQLGAQACDALEHDGQEEGALAREVPVEGALADAAGVGDLAHLHLVVVVQRENGLRGAKDRGGQTCDRRAATSARDGPEGGGGGHNF